MCKSASLLLADIVCYDFKTCPRDEFPLPYPLPSMLDWSLASLLTHSSVSSSDTICNNLSPRLLDNMHFNQLFKIVRLELNI